LPYKKFQHAKIYKKSGTKRKIDKKNQNSANCLLKTHIMAEANQVMLVLYKIQKFKDSKIKSLNL
jgi:hypothetical protein